jgi:hypothetical protein
VAARASGELSMRRLTAFNRVTLHGVMQAPGRSDEDRRGGFEHGGRAAPYAESCVDSGNGPELEHRSETEDLVLVACSPWAALASEPGARMDPLRQALMSLGLLAVTGHGVRVPLR